MEKSGTGPMFFELCRLCLKNTGENLIFEIESLPDDIFVFTGVRVSPSDNLPQKVCLTCLSIISNVKELKILAINNDVHLHFLFEEEQPPIENICNVTSESYSVRKEAPKSADKRDNISDILPSSTTSNPGSISIKLSVRKDLFPKTHIDKQTVKTQPNEDKEWQILPSKTVNENVISQSHRDKERISSESYRDKDRKKSKHKHKERSHRDKDRERERRKKKKKDRRRERDNETESPSTSATMPKVEGLKDVKCSPSKRINSERELFTCEICSKVVRTWRRFYNHQRLHNKKCTCPFDACGKTFATKGDLAKHVRTHTGEKPFKCSLCDKGFAQNVTLKGHMQAMH